jgi:hypothetical protein
MGEGQQIRDFIIDEREMQTLDERRYLQLKRLKGEEEEILISDDERLMRALGC